MSFDVTEIKHATEVLRLRWKMNHHLIGIAGKSIGWKNGISTNTPLINSDEQNHGNCQVAKSTRRWRITLQVFI